MLNQAISVIKSELLRVNALGRRVLYLKMSEFWDEPDANHERIIGEALSYLQAQGVVEFREGDSFTFHPSPNGVPRITVHIESLDRRRLQRLIPPDLGARNLSYDPRNHVLGYAGQSVVVSGSRQRVFLEVMFEHPIGEEVSWDEIWERITGEQNSRLDSGATEKVRTAYRGVEKKLLDNFELPDGFARVPLGYIRLK